MPEQELPFGPDWDIASWSVWAVEAAADRLRNVSWHDPHLAYAATGEVLWWIAVLDELIGRKLGVLYEESKDQEQGIRPLMLGLKHARNRMTHAFDVLEPVEPGFPVKQELGEPGHWSWRHLEPPARQGGSADEEYLAYEAVIADEFVQQTLSDVLPFLRNLDWRMKQPGRNQR